METIKETTLYEKTEYLCADRDYVALNEFYHQLMDELSGYGFMPSSQYDFILSPDNILVTELYRCKYDFKLIGDGGEKQKVAIARAIYKNAPFVIMDEPTAALDPESECEVYAGFDKMVGNKTAIYISHRLASCRFCGDILVFDRGAVVQRGRHEELERQEGLYRELWNAQAQYYM